MDANSKWQRYWYPRGDIRNQPIIAANTVATSQPLAVQAGLNALARGGSAVDAALAAAITLTVVEPTSNGIGSDAMAMVWDGIKVHGLNASGRSPKAWTPAMFAQHLPKRGWMSVTVPGAVSAWQALHERWGVLPFADLFVDAIRHAREGFPVAPLTAAAWASVDDELLNVPGFRQAFFAQGAAPAAGARFAFADQAWSLTEIAASNGRSFYQGRLAEAMCRTAREQGGLLTMDDLAAHQPSWVDPISFRSDGVGGHRPLHLVELGPNTQGIAAQMALGIAQRAGINRLDPEGGAWYHIQIEAMRLALREVYQHVGDPKHMRVSVEHLLSESRLYQLATLIKPQQSSGLTPRMSADGGTVLVCAADSRGMLVSLIQSNFHGFGSGVVVPGTGISLNNRGYGFSLEKGHANEVAGGKQPFHTIIPAFVTDLEGRPELAFGCMGGSMQAQGHLQLFLRIFGNGDNPQRASDAPRWRVEDNGMVGIENGFPEAVRSELARYGHILVERPSSAFGGAQLIQRHGDYWVAASDHRKDGYAGGA